MKKKNKSKKQEKQQETSGARTTTVTAPVAKATKTSGAKAPNMQTAPNGTTVIKHREYCTDVYQNSITSGAYNYRVNPQNAEIFPWLSAIATRFEMYKFRKLKFGFKASCPTTTPGFVVMGFDFDYSDYTTDTPSKSTMLTWKYSTKSAPWDSMMLDVSLDANRSTYKYCDVSRAGGTTYDPRLDNLGALFVMAQATGASSVYIGELFVEYEIELIQPSYKLPSALWLTVKPTNPLPGADQPFAGPLNVTGNLNYQVNPATPGSITISDVGQFIVELIETGTAITSAMNAVGLGLFPGTNATISEVLRKYSSDGTKSILTNILNVKTPPVQLQFSGGNGLGLTSDLKISTYQP